MYFRGCLTSQPTCMKLQSGNHCQWTIISNVLVEILSLRYLATLIRALHWIVATGRPVIAYNIIVVRLAILAAHTTEGPLWALQLVILVKKLVATLEEEKKNI